MSQTQNNDSGGWLILITIAFIVLSQSSGPDAVTPVVPDTPEPTAALKQLTEPIRQLPRTDASPRLAGFLYATADVIEDNPDAIATTEQFVTFYQKANTFMVRGIDLGRGVPGFGAAQERILKEALGDDVQPLDESKRIMLLETLRAMAWSLTQ